jgi:probable O-glycosylation ligase (exosortase A-associated)
VFRTIFVVVILAAGWGFALQSPLYAACLYLWIAYFRPESWAWSDIFSSLNLSYIAGVYLVLRTVISGKGFKIDLRSSLLFVFLAHSLISTAFGLHPDYSFGAWQEFAKAIIVSYLLTTLIETPADLRLVLTVIALSLGFEAGKQGWAQLVLNPGAANMNEIPFLGDNNLVAVGMAMLLPIVTALAATSTGWMKRGYQFLSIGVLYRAISTYSRGGFLSIAAVGVIHFWRSQHKLKTAAAVLVATMLIVPVLPQKFWDRMSTITAPADERDESQQSRLYFWSVAVAMANDRPLVGVGHKGYEKAYDQYDWTHGLHGTHRAVHSAWFGMLGDLGYPGLLLFIAIVFTSWLGCRRVRLSAKRGEISKELGEYALGLETALVAFAVGGSFVSFHYCEMLWHYFALTMALQRVAVRERAMAVAKRDDAPDAITAPESPAAEPEFVWG